MSRKRATVMAPPVLTVPKDKGRDGVPGRDVWEEGVVPRQCCFVGRCQGEEVGDQGNSSEGDKARFRDEVGGGTSGRKGIAGLGKH